jgi:hypothetical protein
MHIYTLTQGTGDVKKWTKRVQKEWEILQNNLPGTLCDRQVYFTLKKYRKRAHKDK